MKNIILIFFYLLTVCTSYSQQQQGIPIERTLSLTDAINLAKSESIDYLTAKNNSEISYWTNKSFKSNFFPSININGVLPNYRKSINRITADDGTDLFINQNQAYSSLSLDIDQLVPFTGGKFRISSSLDRIDVFSDTNFSTFSSKPLSISYSQESLFYNPFRWRKKIEPLIYEESKRELIEDMERISLNTTTKFFDFVLAEIKYKNANNNITSQDSIFSISKGRFNIGKLFENDLLQSELSLLNAKKDLVSSKNELIIAKQSLLDQLGVKEELNLNLLVPVELNFIKIDSLLLFKKAFENRKLLIEQARKLLEAEQSVAKTKSDGITIGLTGNFGLTQQDELFEQVYSNLLVQQNFSITLSVPVFSSGKRKSDIKIALSNLDLIKSYNEQELKTAKRKLELKYLDWQQQELSVEISKKASQISVRRYEVSKRRFVIGKVSITDLNIAQKEKDNAVYNYYQSLKSYWELYYEIRLLTLYDFAKNEDINFE